MAKEIPYFRFTVAEWLTGDIDLLSVKEKGVFMDICAFYWFKNCDLTKKTLQKKYKKIKKELNLLISEKIIKHEEENDLIKINFLDEQWELLEPIHMQKVYAGKKSAEARAKRKLEELEKENKKNKNRKKKDSVPTPVEHPLNTRCNECSNKCYSKCSNYKYKYNYKDKDNYNYKDYYAKEYQEVICVFKDISNVLLSIEDYDYLIEKYSMSKIDAIIVKMSRWLVNSSKRSSYKNYKTAIEDWIDRDNGSNGSTEKDISKGIFRNSLDLENIDKKRKSYGV